MIKMIVITSEDIEDINNVVVMIWSPTDKPVVP
jgi:hypothetical protein